MVGRHPSQEGPTTSITSMRPWLLTFSDSHMEKAYDKYALLHHHQQGDLRFFFVTTCVMFAHSIKIASEQNYYLLPAIPYFVCALLCGAMWIIYHFSSVDRTLQLRPYMSIIMRLSMALAGSYSAWYTAWMFSFLANPIFLIIQFLMATETLGNFPYAFGITVKFQQHLVIHFLTYCIFLVGKTPIMCQKISESAGAATLYRLESYIDEFFEFFVSFLYSTIGEQRDTPSFKLPCVHASTFLMTFWSIGVVSWSLWRDEKKNRLEFLQANEAHSHRQAPESRKHFDPISNCVEFMILFTLASLYWSNSVIVSDTVNKLPT